MANSISIQPKQNLVKRKGQFLTFLLNTIFILLIAGSTPIVSNDIFHIVLFICLLFIFFTKGLRVDQFVVVILLIWFFINAAAYYVNRGIDYSLLTLGGVTVKLLYPYFIIKIVGPDFFNSLSRYIYVLVKISLVFYAVDLIYPPLFQSLSGTLNGISYPEQKESGGWYIFIYMHSGWAILQGYDILRNSGFMWEPGAFSLILVFSLVLHFSKNDFQWDRKAIILSISIFTTISTAGYLALIVIVLSFIVFKNKGKSILYPIFFPILIFGSFKLFQQDFISGKLNDYSEAVSTHYTHEESGVERVNRIAIFMYTLEHTLHWPFGNGIFDSLFLKKKYGYIFSGPNIFASILHKWGLFFLLYFCFVLIKFFGFFYKRRSFVIILFVVALGITFFSNPMTLQTLIYAIVYYYLAFIRPLKGRFVAQQSTLPYSQSQRIRNSIVYDKQ